VRVADDRRGDPGDLGGHVHLGKCCTAAWEVGSSTTAAVYDLART
jgi:hypothetical protein